MSSCVLTMAISPFLSFPLTSHIHSRKISSMSSALLPSSVSLSSNFASDEVSEKWKRISLKKYLIRKVKLPPPASSHISTHNTTYYISRSGCDDDDGKRSKGS